MTEILENSPLLEAVAPPQTKRAVVIIGRFQPPTIGHYKIVNLAKKFIRENPNLSLFTKPVIIIIDGKKSSQNKKLNPLTVEERIYFMENSGKANGVVFLSASNAFDAFNVARKEGYEPTVVGAGSDRVDGYLELLDSKFLDAKGNKQKHYELPGLDGRHELRASEESLKKVKNSGVTVTGVSGSLARQAAELDYFEEFAQITGLEKNLPAAKKMFKVVKTRIGEE